MYKVKNRRYTSASGPTLFSPLFTLCILLKLIIYTLYRHPLVSARPRECESPPPLVSARPIECLDAVSPDPLGGELPAEDGFEWCESRGAPHLPPLGLPSESHHVP